MNGKAFENGTTHPLFAKPKPLIQADAISEMY